MKEKTVKLLKLKIEKFTWLSSSLFWIIAAIVALNKQRPLIAVVLLMIGIAMWKGEVKERWKKLSETEDFVRNNWK
jgi:predicted tellurium resistance membrane protein TerC